MAKKILILLKGFAKNIIYAILYSYWSYILYDFFQRLNGYKKERNRVYKKIGYYPDLKNPKSFNEKILWKKVYDRNPLLPIVSDKYRVREYIESVLGPKEARKILVPLLYVTENPATIPFDGLPDEYIIKPNHASGLLIIAENQGGKKKYSVIKRSVNKILFESGDTRQEIISICRGWLLKPYKFYQHEWAYQKIKRKIIIQRLLRDSSGKIPVDYNFTIFYGKCFRISVWYDRFTDLKRGSYTPEWEYLNIQGRYKQAGYRDKPENLKYMIDLAEKLGKPFDYIRVDLYTVDGQIYFGELTNYTAGGTVAFPKSYDFELGTKWELLPKYWQYQYNKKNISLKGQL